MMNRSLITMVLFLSLGMIGCSTKPVVVNPPVQEPVFTSERLVASDVQSPVLVNDPLEGFNRAMYRFNYHADRWVLMPAVRAYRFILPSFLRTGIKNFFNNFYEIRTLANQILQGRPVRALTTTGRFALNTTVGIAGLFDVASAAGMPYYREDFGQTLGVWGVGSGAYLVLPLLGPSNIRDGTGQLADAAFMNWVDPLNFDGHESRQYIFYPLYVLNTRDQIAFQYFQTGSPFEYELVRRLMLTVREIEIEK